MCGFYGEVFKMQTGYGLGIKYLLDGYGYGKNLDGWGIGSEAGGLG